MSTESNSLHPWAYPLHDSPDVARWQSRLPPLLSAVAGMVEVIGFLSLGKLFTAHVTGNLVVIAALLVRGGLVGTTGSCSTTSAP
jgi:cobalamin synthase